MERKNEEEKTKKPWVGRRFLGVAAAAGAVAVAVGAFFVLSRLGDSAEEDQTADDPPAPTLKGPGAGGKMINRNNFERGPGGVLQDQSPEGTQRRR
nr:unnamed protein product [Digitaria exilis]